MSVDYWKEKFNKVGLDIDEISRDDFSRRLSLIDADSASSGAEDYVAASNDYITIDPELIPKEGRISPYDASVERDFVGVVEGLGKLGDVLYNRGYRHILVQGEADDETGIPEFPIEEDGLFSRDNRYIITEFRQTRKVFDFREGADPLAPPLTISMTGTAAHEAFHAGSYVYGVLLDDYTDKQAIPDFEEYLRTGFGRLNEEEVAIFEVLSEEAIRHISDNPDVSQDRNIEARHYSLATLVDFLRDSEISDSFTEAIEFWDELAELNQEPRRISADPLIVEAYQRDIEILQEKGLIGVENIDGEDRVTLSSCGDSRVSTHYTPRSLGGRYEDRHAREEALVEVMSNIFEGKTGPDELAFYFPNTSRAGLDLMDFWQIEVEPQARAQVIARAELSEAEAYQCSVASDSESQAPTAVEQNPSTLQVQ